MYVQRKEGKLFAKEKRVYLSETTPVRVRFQEVDSMNIVWHGHYISYFEEARRALGRTYGIDYTEFRERNVGAPIVQVQVDYLTPAFDGDVLDVEARLYKSEGAKIEFAYEVRNQESGKLLATGTSTQVFCTMQGELLLTWPDFMKERYSAWENLWISPA